MGRPGPAKPKVQKMRVWEIKSRKPVRLAEARPGGAKDAKGPQATPPETNYQLKPVGSVVCLENRGHIGRNLMGKSADAVMIRTNNFGAGRINAEVQMVRVWVCATSNEPACQFQVAKPKKELDAETIKDKIRQSNSEIGGDMVQALEDISRMAVRGKDDVNGEKAVNTVFFMLAHLYLSNRITYDTISALRTVFKRGDLSAQATVAQASLICRLNHIPLSFHVESKESAFQGICYGEPQ